jgi:hypothetical protein
VVFRQDVVLQKALEARIPQGCEEKRGAQRAPNYSRPKVNNFSR